MTGETPGTAPLLDAAHLSKRYARDLRKAQRYGVRAVLDELRPSADNAQDLRDSEFWAVRDVSLQLRRGEAVGIVGRNGAGKSTLLRMIAGISKPSEGRITLGGSLVALLDPNAGFDPVLSGRENVEVVYALHDGRRPSADTIAAIAAYAGLTDVIDAPVRTYSQGMRLRLGFSTVVHIDPDILVIDEALAVGDTAFQLQCLEQLHAFRRAGGALLFVSHSLWLFQHLATRGLHLSNGRILCEADPATIADNYLEELQRESWEEAGDGPDLLDRERGPILGSVTTPADPDPDGGANDDRGESTRPQRPVTFGKVTMTGPGGSEPRTGSPATVRFELDVHDPVAVAELALTVWTADLSVCIAGDITRDVLGDSATQRFELERGRSMLHYDVDRLMFTPGRYAIRAAVFNAETSDVMGLLGYEDSPAWVEVFPPLDATDSPDSGFSSTPRMRPLRTLTAAWGSPTAE